VLGSSFGGFVALAYAGLFPAHPGGIILANTTGGRSIQTIDVNLHYFRHEAARFEPWSVLAESSSDTSRTERRDDTRPPRWGALAGSRCALR
jgi:pimeloyl-ACP methyl ester carboxylesterase